MSIKKPIMSQLTKILKQIDLSLIKLDTADLYYNDFLDEINNIKQNIYLKEFSSDEEFVKILLGFIDSIYEYDFMFESPVEYTWLEYCHTDVDLGLNIYTIWSYCIITNILCVCNDTIMDMICYHACNNKDHNIYHILKSIICTVEDHHHQLFYTVAKYNPDYKVLISLWKYGLCSKEDIAYCLRNANEDGITYNRFVHSLHWYNKDKQNRNISYEHIKALYYYSVMFSRFEVFMESMILLNRYASNIKILKQFDYNEVDVSKKKTLYHPYTLLNMDWNSIFKYYKHNERENNFVEKWIYVVDHMDICEVYLDLFKMNEDDMIILTRKMMTDRCIFIKKCQNAEMNHKRYYKNLFQNIMIPELAELCMTYMFILWYKQD